jgi:CheY-like chemotaxis protein
MDDLFKPFVQTSSGRHAREGTGLGLALSRQLARAMDGDIKVASTVGVGTTFTVEVTLPAAAEARVVQVERRMVRALADGEPAYRILVVDDVRDNRTLLSTLLSSVGFDVREASGGEEAVALWRAWSPQLIFMDKRMRGVDGLQATATIREEEALTAIARTPIIALTASALEHERDQILASGCDDFIAKPFRQGTIFAALSQHLGVRFAYAEAGATAEAQAPAAPITAEALAGMPAAWIAEMQRAVTTGNTKTATGLVDEIAARNGLAAEAIRAMLRRYEFEVLEALLAAASSRVADTRARPES